MVMNIYTQLENLNPANEFDNATRKTACDDILALLGEGQVFASDQQMMTLVMYLLYDMLGM